MKHTLITEDVERTLLSALAFGNFKLDFYSKQLGEALISLMEKGQIRPLSDDQYEVTREGKAALVIYP